MGILEWFSDLKNSLEGKFLAVFMAVVLILSLASVAAYAANDASNSKTTGEELLIQNTTELAPEPDQALVEFSYTNATLAVRGQDLIRPDLLVEAGALLTFTAKPDEGYEIVEVSATNKATGNAVAVIEEGANFRIASANVTNGLAVTVATKPLKESGLTQNISVEITGKNKTVTYDGTNHVLDGYSYTVTDEAGNKLDKNLVTVTAPVFGVQEKNAGAYKLGLSEEGFVVSPVDPEAYALANLTVVDGVLEITRAPLYVAANVSHKREGEKDPAFTYSQSKAASDEEAVFIGTLERAPGESVGMYEIGLGTLTIVDNGTFLTSNYELVFESAMFSINGE